MAFLDQSLIARLLLVILASQCSLSTLLLVQVIYGRLEDSTERVNITVALTAQVLLALLICQVMVRITVAMHSSAPMLYRAQMMLKLRGDAVGGGGGGGGGGGVGDRLLVDKLELMVFYELVHSQEKCCFHLGSLANVTKKSCLDVRYVLF